MQRTSIANVKGHYAVFVEVGQHNLLAMSGLTEAGARWVAGKLGAVDGDKHDVKQAISHIRHTLPGEYDAIFQTIR